MNAKGRWPLRVSGIPTTQHSAMEGWVEMACSIEPVDLSNSTFIYRMLAFEEEKRIEIEKRDETYQY